MEIHSPRPCQTAIEIGQSAHCIAASKNTRPYLRNDVPKVSPDAAPLLLALATILLGDQHLLYPAVDLRTLLPHEIDPFAGFQELADLVWFQTLGVLHSYLLPPQHAYLTPPIFRIILYWKQVWFQDHLVLDKPEYRS